MSSVINDALAQPVQNPAPDPTQPTYTPQQAQMQESQPHPEHAMQESDSGFSFDQAVKGMKMSFRRWIAAEASYTSIREILAGRRPAPIIPLPTGKLDEEGKQIIYELDLDATLPKGMPETDRLELIKRQLGPWNNHLCKEYKVWVKKMLQFVLTMDKLLSPEDYQQAAPIQQTAPPAQMPMQQIVPPPPVGTM